MRVFMMKEIGSYFVALGRDWVTRGLLFVTRRYVITDDRDSAHVCY